MKDVVEAVLEEDGLTVNDAAVMLWSILWALEGDFSMTCLASLTHLVSSKCTIRLRVPFYEGFTSSRAGAGDKGGNGTGQCAVC